MAGKAAGHRKRFATLAGRAGGVFVFDIGYMFWSRLYKMRSEEKIIRRTAMDDKKRRISDAQHEGRDVMYMDIDRMINEGLGGGRVTDQNGLIEETTTHTMDDEE